MVTGKPETQVGWLCLEESVHADERIRRWASPIVIQPIFQRDSARVPAWLAKECKRYDLGKRRQRIVQSSQVAQQLQAIKDAEFNSNDRYAAARW